MATISCFLVLLTAMQMSMNGFAGFDFGSNKQAVQEIIREKGALTLVSESRDTLLHSGGSYNGFPVDRWQFVFQGGRLSTLKLEFAGEDQRSIFYVSLLNSLTKTYGRRNTVDENGGTIVQKWNFYFPQGSGTASTYVLISFHKDRALFIKAGITH
jgi:hypothetical protein